MTKFSAYKLILIGFLMTFLGLLSPVFASQGGAGTGGGEWVGSDLKHMLEKLSQYIYSPDGQKLYSDTEVATFDSSHKGLTLKKIFQELNPIIVRERVFDQFGNERDCVSGNSKELGRYFKCNANNLPKKPGNDDSGKEFWGSMYRLCLHEVFVQADLEKPVDKELPSIYPLASRLMIHLENFPEWVPGAAVNVPAVTTFETAADAYSRAKIPTLHDLTGSWVRIGFVRAGLPGSYSPNGLENNPIYINGHYQSDHSINALFVSSHNYVSLYALGKVTTKQEGIRLYVTDSGAQFLQYMYDRSGTKFNTSLYNEQSCGSSGTDDCPINLQNYATYSCRMLEGVSSPTQQFPQLLCAIYSNDEKDPYWYILFKY